MFHSSRNDNGNITVTSADHSPVSSVHKQHYYVCSNSHTTVPSKHLQCVVCGKGVQQLNLHMKMHTGEKQFQCSVCGQHFVQKCSLEKHNTLLQWSGCTFVVCVVKVQVQVGFKSAHQITHRMCICVPYVGRS